MGGGAYSNASAMNTRALGDFHTKSNDQIFTNRTLDNEMNPANTGIRESRDSDEHPNSLGIIIGLDLTGSMGSIPQMLVRDGLPDIMGKIIQNGEPDPQVLFLGIGDHECDNSPLQVGQFESSDKKLDHWLLKTYLEGGGGGNHGESYLLAWYFAATHTSIDCHEKRGRKGLLFTIGDEPTLQSIPKRSLDSIMGTGQHQDYSAIELLEMARKSYDVYHIHLLSTGTGNFYKNEGSWDQLLGDRLVMAQSPGQVASIIADLVIAHKGGSTEDAVTQTPTTTAIENQEDVVL